MNKFMPLTSVLCFLIVAPPVLGQAEDAEEPRVIDEQAERAIRELFQGLQLDDGDDPVEQLLEHRRDVEEIQRRVIQLQLDGPRLRLDRDRAAEPVQLDAKPIVNPWAKRSRDEVIAGLDHAKFGVRESAEALLLMDNTLGKAVLKQLVQQAKSPEQRQRLLRVAEHHVLREMREREFGKQRDVGDVKEDGPFPGLRRPASVGYSYEPVLAHENPAADLPGVRVIATMPGFPGHAHLRRGDIIVQINGQGLSNHHREHDITNWVRWQIASREAGDSIDFTVQRGGELLVVEMVCAEGIALGHMYTTDAFESAARKGQYQRAWEDAYQELTAQMPKPATLTPVALDAGE